MRIDHIVIPAYVLDKLHWKHHVFEEEVYEVLRTRPAIYFTERGDIQGEDLYRALGRTETGRYLVVFFIRKRNNQVLVISARDMTKRERKRYERR